MTDTRPLLETLDRAAEEVETEAVYAETFQYTDDPEKCADAARLRELRSVLEASGPSIGPILAALKSPGLHGNYEIEDEREAIESVGRLARLLNEGKNRA